MKCVVLQNADGAHLGFMLCSPDLGQPSGDCVFMAVPGQAELFDTPAAELLFQRREAGENSWRVVGREPLYGAVEEGEAATLRVGQVIVATLGRHGLETRWNGSADTRIKVNLDWKRRLPQRADA